MTWQLWLIFTLFIIRVVARPLTVGKVYEPSTARVATGVAVLDAAFAALVWWGGHS